MKLLATTLAIANLLLLCQAGYYRSPVFGHKSFYRPYYKYNYPKFGLHIPKTVSLVGYGGYAPYYNYGGYYGGYGSYGAYGYPSYGFGFGGYPWFGYDGDDFDDGYPDFF